MKKTFIFALLISFAHIIWAGPVTKEEAKQKALQFLASKPQKLMELKSVGDGNVTESLMEARTPECFYAFNLGNQQGFVLVSSDDRTHSILGYAERGSFDMKTIPDNMRWWLNEYQRQLNFLDQYEVVKENKIARTPIAPFIRTKWNQGYPYWNMCPNDPVTNKNSVTGCVATAMAQIMNYHQYPQKTFVTIPAYTSISNEIKLPAVAPTEIEWDSMLDEYDYTATSKQQAAVAQLMYLCGSSVEMDYSSTGSGAYSIDIPAALKNIFGYDEGMKYLLREEYTAEEWNELVYNELLANRPVLYTGQSVGGGHAFVVDGYNEDHLFHVNWGWGGRCDGYFLLSILNPYDNEGVGASSSTDGYSYNQQIVVGIQPPTDISSETDRLTSTYFFIDSEKVVTTYDRNKTNDFTIPVSYSFRNNTMSEIDFEYGMGVFDEEDKLVETHVFGNRTAMPLEYIGNSTINADFGRNLKNGNYTIKGISRRSANEEWQVNICSDMWMLLISIDDAKLSVTTPFYSYNAELQILTEHPKVNVPLNVRVHLRNYGMTQHETLYLKVNDKKVAGRQFEVGTDESVNFDFSYLPTQSGTYEMKLVQPISYYYDRTLATTTIKVEPGDSIELLNEISIEGLNSKSRIPTTTANITVSITNNSTVTYDDDVMGVFYKWNGQDFENESYYQHITLASGASTEWELNIEGLEDGAEYSFLFAYKNVYSIWEADWNGETYFTVDVEKDIVYEDMTSLITNPGFEQGENGWIIEAAPGGNVRIGGNANNRCFEAWNNSSFNIYQVQRDLPAGVYEIQVQGFYRYLRGDNAWNEYQNAEGKIDIPTYVYINNSNTAFKNVFDEQQAYGALYTGDYYTEPSGKYSFPNDMVTSSQAFDYGMYQQSAFGIVTDKDEFVLFGVKGRSDRGYDSWVIWDNFRLIYHGFHANTIEPVLAKAISDSKNSLDKIMSKSAYNRLISSIEEAEGAKMRTDGVEMFTKLHALYDAQEKALTSAELFIDVTKALSDLSWHINHDEVASNSVITDACWLYATTLADAENHKLEDADIEGIVEKIHQMIWNVQMPKDMDKASIDNPVECTTLLVSPSFENDGENTVFGWGGYGTANYGNDANQVATLAIEFYQSTFNIYQSIYDIPDGYYRLQVSSFYRYGSAEDDLNTFLNGRKQFQAFIYMNNGSKTEQTPVKLLSEGATDTKVNRGAEIQNSVGLWVPNDMVSSVNYFKKGRYQNECTIEVKDGYLQVGAKKEGIVAYDWVMLDDFRLFYLGTEPPVSSVSDVFNDAEIVEREYFNLKGQKSDSPQQGIQIVREVRRDGSVTVRKYLNP